jgi:predicted Zn-dependent peptidase
VRNDLGLAYSVGFFQTYKWTTGFLIGYIGCKGDKTTEAIKETIKVMRTLQQEVPENEIEQKRLDALNSFVFNVDTPSALVEVYGNYYIRNEPLDTLERIQDAYISATKEDLERLARQLLNPGELQIVVVGDKETRVRTENGKEITLEEDLMSYANELGLPYREIPLR